MTVLNERNYPMQLDASVAAIVTGCASGLGGATARRLAWHGVKVALFDLATELGERVAGEIGACSARLT
jgi:NADP-dependent 3-hydroxy acid dehydrogenase YdfG